MLAPEHATRQFNAILHNHPSGVTQPSQADMSYAARMSNEGIGFFIIDNNAEHLTAVVPPVVLPKEKPLAADDIRAYFTNDGILSRHKSDFEFRQGQLDMAADVADAFNNNSIAILEAGTGTGKSFAYLIPAFLWAEKNDKRVVISTATIALQHQIFEKDIPMVKKMLNSPLNAALVKGRKNYLCKMKLLNIQGELMFDDDEETQNVMDWAANTDTGCIDELQFTPSNDVWERVCGDPDFCLGHNCEFFQSCFLQMARRKATEAHMLILNHHLLFADIQIRSEGAGLDENSLLPPYRKIIFDEAHNIDKSAGSFFAGQFSKGGFYKFLGLFKQRGNKGFLIQMANKFGKSKIAAVNKFADIINDQIIPDFTVLYSNSVEIFDEIDEYIGRMIKADNPYRSGNRISHQHRITAEEWEDPTFIEQVRSNIGQININLENFAKSVELLIDKFNIAADSVKDKHDIDFKMFKAYFNKLENMQQVINKIINSDCEDNVMWFELFGDYESPLWTINTAPIDTVKILKEKVYDVFDSIVFTSATLSVDSKFDYFKNLTGLSLVRDKAIAAKIYPSPFDYMKQVLFISPDHIPEPNSSAYNDELNEFLRQTIAKTGGSAFVLFTSYSQLGKSYDAVADYLEDKGIRALKQGQMPNGKLVTTFKDDIHSTLFGTDSFWEGVDAPGDTLRYVILTRLPFRMPSDPLEQAKVESMERRGLNPFMDYTLPSAVIRFKQGFGRLIRSRHDYGVVTLLDSRALNKSYGRTFFRSLPRCRFVTGSLAQLCDEIGKFFAENEGKDRHNKK